jgi:hypothetical protein
VRGRSDRSAAQQLGSERAQPPGSIRQLGDRGATLDY